MKINYNCSDKSFVTAYIHYKVRDEAYTLSIKDATFLAKRLVDLEHIPHNSDSREIKAEKKQINCIFQNTGYFDDDCNIIPLTVNLTNKQRSIVTILWRTLDY